MLLNANTEQPLSAHVQINDVHQATQILALTTKWHADVVVGGVPVSLLDTAGMREASDVVEQLGVERSRTAATAADIAIMVVDAQVSLLSQPNQLEYVSSQESLCHCW